MSTTSTSGSRDPQAGPSNPSKSSRKPRFRVATQPVDADASATNNRSARAITIRKGGSNRRLGQRKSKAVQDPQVEASTIPQTSVTTEAEHPDIGSSELHESQALDDPVNSHFDFTCDAALNTNSNAESVSSRKHKKAGNKRMNTTSSRLQEWILFRESFLYESLRLEGKGDFYNRDTCATCEKKQATLRCTDCLGRSDMQCGDCLVESHENLPLHRIEQWNGKFFEKTNLKKLGLQVQLGHGHGGATCPNSLPGPSDFLVFDTSGIHQVSIKYCDCQANNITHKRVQLFRVGWFPATSDRPKTVFTRDVLKTFHELTLQSKISVYDFYHAILRRTDNLELGKITYRYPEFHRVFRIWTNLQILKRTGRGHDPGGIDATSEGELTLECPACPHPGKNLPTNWETAPPFFQFLYTLFLAIDANFKLKRKDRQIEDFELAPGWGCYVETSRYEKHLKEYIEEPEINSCDSDHDAIARANTAVPGYAVNGTAVVICSRHGLVRPNGVADLPKGEKFCIIDYIVLSCLIGVILPHILISYDIGCQWQKKFLQRMRKYSDDMQLAPDTDVEIGIPSWHCNVHGPYCRNYLCLNYIPGVGRTCGEDVETCWAHTNSLAPSTREMGPAARRETLNEHWNGWNFRKIVGFRQLFLKRFKDAIVMKKKQAEIFTSLNTTFPTGTTAKWTQMVEDWKMDRTKPNPYEDPVSTTTVQDVRLELARQDAADAASGQLSPHQTSLTTFLMKGLELEEQQRLLKHEVSQLQGSSAKQNADLQQKRNNLYRQIQKWREAQAVYTPHASVLCVSILSDHPESIPLFLPSALPIHLHSDESMKEICKKELRLRIAQADDALADIRRGRQMITGLHVFKKYNISGAGNKPATKMRAPFNKFTTKIARTAERYRAARVALLLLQPDGGDWVQRLLPLEARDIRGPGKGDDEPVAKGRFEPSWIWTVQRVCSAPDMGSSEVVFNEAMRAEWAKSLARKERWDEEYLLVQEEMRRSLAYYEWKADWWHYQAKRRCEGDPILLQALEAYAEKQASMQEQLALSSARIWLPALHAENISPLWETKYLELIKGLDRQNIVEPEAIEDLEEVMDDESDSSLGDKEDEKDLTDIDD